MLSASPGTTAVGHSVSDWVLVAGLALAAVLYLGFPAESIYGNRDEGVYTNHGIYLANHGRLDLPYPWPADAAAIFADRWVGFPGFYKTQPTMTVQFGHLFSVWLAQAYGSFGAVGLFRLNATLALVSLAIFYGLCRTAMPPAYAAGATLFLAFNPSQLWIARIALSEVTAQLFIGSGLLALVTALRGRDRPLARWAGVFFGLAVFTRLDSILLLPLLLLAHALVRVVEGPQAPSKPVWPALYQTALPVVVLGLGYYACFSAPYFQLPEKILYLTHCRDATLAAAVIALTVSAGTTERPALWSSTYRAALPAFVLALAYCLYFDTPHVPPLIEPPLLRALAASALLALLVLLMAATGLPRRLRPWLLSQPMLACVGAGLLAVAAYAYWVRPVPSPAPQLRFRWPGYYIDMSRDYSRDALVNLGRYLSPPVIWAALFGWVVTLWELVRKERDVILAPVLVATLVVSTVHLQMPVPEDHFWVIRRYVPLAIPGFALFATLAVRWALDRLPPPWVKVAAAPVVAFAMGFTLWADRLILTFAEDPGFYAQIEGVAEHVPRDELILARGYTEWITPLYVAFDRRMVSLNLDPGHPGNRALEAWVARQAARDQPAYLLTEWPTDLTRYRARVLFERTLSRTYTQPTVDPLPDRLVTKQYRLRLYEIRPAG